MRTFITGATGYIGEQLATKLASDNHHVVALVRSPEKAGSLAAAGVECVTGDLHDQEAIENGMKGCDTVFHLAAYASVWPEDEEVFRKTNVLGTKTILDAAIKNGVKKVVVTSTAGVYGPSDSAISAVDENTTRSCPYFAAYEATKAKAEALAKEYAKNGLHVVIVNPARVYGPGRRSESNAINKLAQLYLENKWHYIPGSGKSTGSYCYIDDVVDGHIKALEQGRSGEVYLFGGENASYDRFFHLLQKLSGKQKKLYRIPVNLLVTASRLMVFWARTTNTKPLITPNWVKKYMYNWSVSSQKAVHELNYTITPLEEGLKRTLNHLKYEYR
ncbi:SDR family oxidoreductase [Pontibacter silvestris]|uniref:SDR family oxidoreductase n=1 Tax=Pontibacter silvestris TaxID=2305183 RepID=A0ABW4X2Y6_9BACT|nr:SDR family oxidoreductase [Pontibacter silvestris]MCC9135093.1 SDR family oxidoreductase [Pontibacter silvestris]